MGQKDIISGECNTDFQPAKSLFSTVPPIVRQLTKGFASKKWSSHNEPVPIPSKSEIEKLVRQAQQILFPGYFTGMILSAESLEYHLGQTLSSFYENLAKQVSSAIRHDCFRHNKACTKCGERSYERSRRLIFIHLRWINAPQQQASLSQNAQWRSQNPFKPFVKFCNLFVGHNTRSIW